MRKTVITEIEADLGTLICREFYPPDGMFDDCYVRFDTFENGDYSMVIDGYLNKEEWTKLAAWINDQIKALPAQPR